MKAIKQFDQIYLYRFLVDFRKQINGLSVFVAEELNLKFVDSAIFVFTNKGKNQVMDTSLQNIPNQYKSLFSDLLKQVDELKSENSRLKDIVQIFLHRKYSSQADLIPPGVKFIFNEAEEEAGQENIEDSSSS